MFNGQMYASENVLCQCLYTRNILPGQLLKMRSFEALGIGSDSRTCKEQSIMATIHRSRIFVCVSLFLNRITTKGNFFIVTDFSCPITNLSYHQWSRFVKFGQNSRYICCQQLTQLVIGLILPVYKYIFLWYHNASRKESKDTLRIGTG